MATWKNPVNFECIRVSWLDRPLPTARTSVSMAAFNVFSPLPMVNNAPSRRSAPQDLTIEGYSRAAVQTYWRIPELKLGFDLGAQPWSFMGTETWFVTHGHLDHIAALPVYVARRRMMKMTPPVIYLPAETIEPCRNSCSNSRGSIAAACRAICGRSRRATRSSCRASTWSPFRPRSTRCRRWVSSCGIAGGS